MAGPLTMVFLASSLTAGERGIYYSLASIMSIQLFFELGLLNIVISQVGHQTSLEKSATNQAERNLAHFRLASLIVAAERWFRVASLMFIVAAIFMGWWTLGSVQTAIDWWPPLIVLSLLAGVTVSLSPRLAILEGAGHREHVYRTRLIQMVSGAVLIWSSLLSGLKIWALVASSSAQLIFSLYLTQVAFRDFFRRYRYEHSTSLPEEDIKWSWLREVLPLQWRIALISIVYHAATQFFTVIVLCFDSEQEAGRLGMTLAATGAIQSMALAWVHTKFSLVSSLHGAGRREEAGTLWRRSAVISTGLLTVTMAVAISIVASLPLAGRGWESVFVTPLQMLILAVGCLANHWIALQSFYVLSRQGKPFLFAALVGFSCTGLAVLCGGFYYSTMGVVCGYTLTTALITFPLHSLAYWKYRQSISVV